MSEQAVVLDSCVVIDLMENPGVFNKFRAAMKGKSIRFILCDIVLNEVYRVKRFATRKVISRIAKVGKRIDIFSIDEGEKRLAQSMTERYAICHNGDNQILALCRSRSLFLVTRDRNLLRACEYAGVLAFHQKRAREI